MGWEFQMADFKWQRRQKKRNVGSALFRLAVHHHEDGEQGDDEGDG
jgi:hypothetical protein